MHILNWLISSRITIGIAYSRGVESHVRVQLLGVGGQGTLFNFRIANGLN
jgi:hypothetical protein